MFTPASLGFAVSADASIGLFNAASGGTAVTTNGGVVTGWTNSGSLGGRLAAMTAGSLTGPLLRTNSGVPYLESGPSGLNKYALGIDIPSSPSGDMTLAILCRHTHTEGSTGGQNHCVLWTTGGSLGNDHGGNACYLTDRAYGLTIAGYSLDGYTSATSFIPICDGRWHFVAFRRTAGTPNSTWEAWIDGQLVLSGTTTTTETIDRFNVGGALDYVGFKGDYAIAHFVHSRLSDSALSNLWNYYADNHALLAADDKVMVVCGDSTSTPANAFASWATAATWYMPRGPVAQYGSYLQANNGLGRFWNNSWGGKSTSQHRTATEIARVAGWLSRGTSKRVLVIDSGTNDIRAGGAGLTPAQSHAQILGLITDVRAAVTVGRVEVVVSTICDGNSAVYAGFTALRNTFNGLIVDGAAAGDYVVARVDQDAVIGPDWGDVARLDTYFYGDPLDANRDGLHPIGGPTSAAESGMGRKAVVIQTAIAGVL